MRRAFIAACVLVFALALFLQGAAGLAERSGPGPDRVAALPAAAALTAVAETGAPGGKLDRTLAGESPDIATPAFPAIVARDAGAGGPVARWPGPAGSQVRSVHGARAPPGPFV
jgi:hypothetical protein